MKQVSSLNPVWAHCLPDALAALDHEGKVVVWSKKATELLEIDVHNIVGMPIHVVLGQEQGECGLLKLLASHDQRTAPNELFDEKWNTTICVSPIFETEDEFKGIWCRFKRNDSPVQALDELTECKRDVQLVAAAIEAGDLSKRCNTNYQTPELCQIGTLSNEILERLLTPLRTASVSLDMIARGDIPEFIIDEYHGEFNQIKKNINNFLATMYGMHYEVNNLIGKIRDGKLKTRGNDWDYEGIWQELIAGMNSVLDAIIEPVVDASNVLERVAAYDLATIMTTNYKGEHAKIKKALNSTVKTLSASLTKVSQVVKHVSDAGEEVLNASNSVAAGSDNQSDKIRETSRVLSEVVTLCQSNTEHARQASHLSKEAHESINTEKDRMDSLLLAMEGINNSAENTQQIIRTMTDIGVKTDELAIKAASEAAYVNASSRGFAVVADQIRELADQSQKASTEMYRCSETIAKLAQAGKLDQVMVLTEKLNEVAGKINNIARQTNFIALNAAVDSAHVSEAGSSFQEIVATIQGLANQSKEATVQSESLIMNSIKMSKEGETISKEVNQNLENAVNIVSHVAKLVDSNETAAKEQVRGIDDVNQAVTLIDKVTLENTAIAEKSSDIARELANQTHILSGIVNQFELMA